MDGIVECEGIFAVERAGFEFYFVKVEHVVFLIEKSTGHSIGNSATACNYKKKLLLRLESRSDEEIIKAINKCKKI